MISSSIPTFTHAHSEDSPEVGHLCCAVAKIPSFLFPRPPHESPSTSRRSVASLVATAAAGKIPDHHHGDRAAPKGWAGGGVGCWGGADSCVVNGNCGLPASVTVTDETRLSPPRQTATTNAAVPLNRRQSSSFLHNLRHSARCLPRSDDRRAYPRIQQRLVRLQKRSSLFLLHCFVCMTRLSAILYADVCKHPRISMRTG